MNKKGLAISGIVYTILILFLALITAILGLLGNRKLLLDKLKNDVMNDLNNNEIVRNLYTDNSGAAYPELGYNMIPVAYKDDAWVYADIYSEWYDYDLKEWANAVILKDSAKTYSVGDIIDINDIDAYFVWIPKYSYKIFDLGEYSSQVSSVTSKANTIEIRFETSNTSDANEGECTTPLTAGSKGNCAVDDYMTHPAFISMNVNGLWVAKFETSGTVSAQEANLTVLPNQKSLTSDIYSGLTVKKMFEISYNYNRELDSHMMKNTEWGAVAYLSHSKYGINSEIRINNSSTKTTGCAASEANGSSYAGCQNAYNTTTGYLASTTGNITGIYDISGGAWEYMASYVQNNYGSSGFDETSISTYDVKYFDVYTSTTDKDYNNRILGDATGEMGPFNTNYRSSWYDDHINFAYPSTPWFSRGADYSGTSVAGAFSFTYTIGSPYGTGSFRLVLAG